MTPLGEMLMFTLNGGDLSPQERRSLLDWTIRPQLRGCPASPTSTCSAASCAPMRWRPIPPAMAARGITTAMLADALQPNNRNDGAGRVRDGEEALLVRAEGRIRTLDDIRAIVVVAHPTGVVRIADVADVRFGALPRNGVVTTQRRGRGGLGHRARAARRQCQDRGERRARKSWRRSSRRCRTGVAIEVFYDRSDLIEKAVWTVQKVLLEAIVLVVVLLMLFLGNLRAALVVSLILPLAVLSTFIVMRLSGYSANIMSLGGLAIAIGLLVDCAVVVVENIAHHFAHAQGRTMSARACG